MYEIIVNIEIVYSKIINYWRNVWQVFQAIKWKVKQKKHLKSKHLSHQQAQLLLIH